jgi:hypothetical protein
MDAVKITRMGTHAMIAGSDKGAVENTVQGLVAKGAKLVSKVEALGQNWVATVEQAEQPADDGCKVVRMGLRIIITGPDRARVQQRVSAVVQEGAELKSGPELRDGQWVALCDEGGIDKTVHRW